MKIYIVSCSPSRVERLLKAAAPLNLDFEVVESPVSTDEEVLRRGKELLEKKKGYPTGIAATLGHIRAMQRIASRDDPYAIIIEDDVRFHKQFNEYLKLVNSFLKTYTCDILSLGFVSVPRRINSFYFEGVEFMNDVGISNPWGAQCYVISKKYAIYFSKRFSGDNLYLNYQGDFVTDCVIFDPIINCNRSTLLTPIAVESSDEQTIAGSTNKPSLDKLGVRLDDFLLKH